MEFTDNLPQEFRGQFEVFIEEGKLIARSSLQTTLGAADTTSHSMAMAVVMSRALWLHSSGFPIVHSTVEDLPFEVNNHFK